MTTPRALSRGPGEPMPTPRKSLRSAPVSLRVCVILMKDERGNPVAQVSDIVDELQAAIDIFKQEANVRLIRSAPFQYDSGFAGNETATADWVSIRQMTPPMSNAGLEELARTSGYRERTSR